MKIRVTAVVLLRKVCLWFYAGLTAPKYHSPFSPCPMSISWIEWGQDYPFIPVGAKPHCLSLLLRTNSDSALHQSTMTPTQPEPFTGGSQDAHQKRGISRHMGSQRSQAYRWRDLPGKSQWVVWDKGRGLNMFRNGAA